MFNLQKSLVAIIAVLTLYGVEARGESFEINNVGGIVWITTSMYGGPPTLSLGPMYDLGGPGLVVWTQSIPGGDPGNVEARDTCMEVLCTPGQVIGTNSSFSGAIGSHWWTSARVNGVYYQFVRVTGWLKFVSSPIVLPNVGSPTEVSIPFTFSGELTGNALQPDVVNPIFTARLSGQGLATFHFWRGYDVLNPNYKLDFIEYRFGPFPISIDIKPDSFPNIINPKSKGKFPVAILTTSFFDATTVNPASVFFGATEVPPVHFALEDVDGDGDLDMVFHFETQYAGIACGNALASLRGETFSGMEFEGSDSIEPVPCN